jgi:hypothetical protein
MWKLSTDRIGVEDVADEQIRRVAEVAGPGIGLW